MALDLKIKLEEAIDHAVMQEELLRMKHNTLSIFMELNNELFIIINHNI